MNGGPHPPTSGDYALAELQTKAKKEPPFYGMSQRDWFAAFALAGALGEFGLRNLDVHDESIARRCYQIAEAMQKVRNEE